MRAWAVRSASCELCGPIWLRPTRSRCAEGLDIKGKSAKTGKLSGFVPFLQISQKKSAVRHGQKSDLQTVNAHLPDGFAEVRRVRLKAAHARRRSAHTPEPHKPLFGPGRALFSAIELGR